MNAIATIKTSKTCNICGRSFELGMFRRSRTTKDGRDPRCRECNSDRHRRARKCATPDLDGTKQCSKCREIKSCREFHRDAKRADGLNCQCKVCIAELQRAWYEKK